MVVFVFGWFVGLWVCLFVLVVTYGVGFVWLVGLSVGLLVGFWFLGLLAGFLVC